MNLRSKRHWHTLANYLQRTWGGVWECLQQNNYSDRSHIRKRNTAAQLSGDLAEDRALSHLQKSGLRLLTRNYRCRYGEIDLIMQAQQLIVFVEVRARTRNTFGGAAASVTHAKQKRIWRTAQHYLSAQKLNARCRFDVVAFEGEALIWLTDTIRL